jgi:hypothetical protein
MVLVGPPSADNVANTIARIGSLLASPDRRRTYAVRAKAAHVSSELDEHFKPNAH